MLDLPVGMQGESAFRAVVNRIGPRPGPAAEAGGALVDESLLQFLRGVHDERPHLEHRRSDRPALQQ